ncbi:hypothetical protein ACTFIU_003567 [Dictyostelium citrinum]
MYYIPCDILKCDNQKKNFDVVRQVVKFNEKLKRVSDLLKEPVKDLENEIGKYKPWYCNGELVTPIYININNGLGPISFPLVEYQINELIKKDVDGLIITSNSKGISFSNNFLIPNELVKIEEWNKTLSKIFLFIREKLMISKDKEIDFKLLNIVISNKDSNSLKSIIPNNDQLCNKGKLFIVFPSKSTGGEILIAEEEAEKVEEADSKSTTTSSSHESTTTTRKRKLPSDEEEEKEEATTTKETKESSTSSPPSFKREFKQTKFQFNGTIGPKVSFVSFLLRYGHSFEIKPVETGIRLYLEYDFTLNKRINTSRSNTNVNTESIKSTPVKTKNNIKELEKEINELFFSSSSSSSSKTNQFNLLCFILNDRYDSDPSTLSKLNKDDEMILNKLKIVANKLKLHLYYNVFEMKEYTYQTSQLGKDFDSDQLKINIGSDLIDCLVGDFSSNSQHRGTCINFSDIIPSDHFSSIEPSFSEEVKHDFVSYNEGYEIPSLIISKNPISLKKKTLEKDTIIISD